jgi:type IV pilus assembly protein PilB
MRIPDSLVEKLLTKSGDFSKEQLAGLHEQAANDKKPLQDIVIKNNLLTEKELTKLYAEEIEVPFIELKAADIKHEVLKLLPERIARQYNAVVFDVEGKDTKLVAMEDPDDIQAINFLQKQLGNKLKVHITPASLLQAALDQYRGNISSELTKVIASNY